IVDLPRDLAVVVEAVLRGDRGVRPAGILDQLAVAALECPEVGIDRADGGTDGPRRGLEFLRDIAVQVVTGLHAQHQVTGETDAETVLRAGRGRRVAGDPGLPITRRRFTAGLVAREQQVAARIMRSGIDL